MASRTDVNGLGIDLLQLARRRSPPMAASGPAPRRQRPAPGWRSTARMASQVEPASQRSRHAVGIYTASLRTLWQCARRSARRLTRTPERLKGLGVVRQQGPQPRVAVRRAPDTAARKSRRRPRRHRLFIRLAERDLAPLPPRHNKELLIRVPRLPLRLVQAAKALPPCHADQAHAHLGSQRARAWPAVAASPAVLQQGDGVGLLRQAW
jgi:hypothetical protein